MRGALHSGLELRVPVTLEYQTRWSFIRGHDPAIRMAVRKFVREEARRAVGERTADNAAIDSG